MSDYVHLREQGQGGGDTGRIGFFRSLPRLTYSTVSVVVVEDQRLALLHWTFLVILLAYVTSGVLVGKTYQATDDFVGAADLKLKGVAIGVHVATGAAMSDSKTLVMDAVEVANPPLEESGLMIATNVVSTTQSRGRCRGAEENVSIPAEVSEVCVCDQSQPKTSCARHGYCPKGRMTANGITTGRCLEGEALGTSNSTITWWCELEAWCPLENEDTEVLLQGISNFTLFIRADGFFPTLAPDEKISSYRDRELIWNSNLFYIGDLVALALRKDLELE